MRDALGTTVTLLVNVPDRVADAASLPADKRTAGMVVKVRPEDAVELVTAGVARFGGGSTGVGTMGAPRLTIDDVIGSPELAAAFLHGRVLNYDGSANNTKRLAVRLTADGTGIEDLTVEDVA